MTKSAPNYTKPFAVLISLFFMWGFITCLNDSLVPHFKDAFQLNYVQSTLVQFAFFIAYFIGSLIYFIISASSGDPINKIGYKNGIIIGLLIAAVGCALFYPAAQFKSFGFFLCALFVLALGFTLLQIAANPFVLILGDSATASNRLNLAGGFNSFGTTIAPIIGGTLILANNVLDYKAVLRSFIGYYLNQNSFESIQYKVKILTHYPAIAHKVYGLIHPIEVNLNTVKTPYLLFAGMFLMLILVFYLTALPRFENMESKEKGIGALKFPQLQLGFFAIFFYVGAEVTVGSFLTSYAGLPDIAGLTKQEATAFVALYWGSLMIGRFTGSLQAFKMDERYKKIFAILIPFIVFAFVRLVLMWKKIDVQHSYIYIIFILISIAAFFLAQFKPARTMMLFPVFCIGLLSIAILASGHLALWALVSVGLYNSVMWPCIFDLSIKGLGKHTSQGSSILVMGILGGALLPPLQGLVADSSLGLHLSFFVPIVCYAYLFYFGYKVRKILIKQKVYDESAHSSGH